MFNNVVYMVLGHPLHFSLVTFDKIQAKFLILSKMYPEFLIKAGRM